MQTYNVTLGGFAPGNEIYNVSVWFGRGPARQLGWFPYSLYSFASNRLPTPRGGLLVPVNGANFTLATGWIGRYGCHGILFLEPALCLMQGSLVWVPLCGATLHVLRSPEPRPCWQLL